jgi:hypothetical protein
MASGTWEKRLPQQGESIDDLMMLVSNHTPLPNGVSLANRVIYCSTASGDNIFLFFFNN